MATAAPVIEAEMDHWVALGGRNSGIVGDDNHRSGFHRAANEVGPDDYSRRRDPNGANGPYVNWDWACAGDFWHGGHPRLRAMHRRLLARLEAGELPMVCEFIGQVDADGPVIYWSRWGGRSRYRGSGHGLWSHIAWFRSRANQRAYLWIQEEDDMTPGERWVLHVINYRVEAIKSNRATIRVPARPDLGPSYKAFEEPNRLATALGEVDPDEQAFAAAVLAELTPEKIAAAIPPELAQRVADELGRRLGAPAS